MWRLGGGSQPAPSPRDGPAWRDLNSHCSVSAVIMNCPFSSCKGNSAGMDGISLQKGSFQGGKGSCRGVQNVPTCQTCHPRFTFSFSYQHPYPDRPKTDSSECQRTNSWCTQAERSHVPNVQLFVSRRALHQIRHSGPEIPGIPMGNSVLSLILLSALEGAWWFHLSPQEEGWVHWAHLDLFLGASAVFTLQHLLILGNKQRQNTSASIAHVY